MLTENLTTSPSSNNESDVLRFDPAKVSMGINGLANKVKSKLLFIDADNGRFERYKILMRAKYQLLQSQNTHDAFNKVLSIIPDAIIVVSRFSKDEITFLFTAIKNHVLTCHLPLIVLCPQSEIDYKVHCLSLGADAVVDHDCAEQLIIVQVNNVLKNRKVLKHYYSNESSLANSVTSLSSDDLFVLRLQKAIESNYSNSDYNVSQLVSEMGISRSNLYMRLKAITGESTSTFLRNIRLKKGAELLRQGHLNVSEVAYQIGLKDPKYFSKKFKSYFGVSPSAFLKGDTSISNQKALTSIKHYASPETPA